MKLPGLIDIHVHLRDPGQTHKEDFTTGTQAALAGGFTQVFDMPNNAQPITTKARLDEKIALAKKKTVIDIGFYYGSLGDNLDTFKQVQDSVFGLKLYLNITTGHYKIDLATVERIYRAWDSKKPILLHSEEDVIENVIDIIGKTRQPSHFCHVSSEHELSAILRAKEKGLPVTCGACPHHLFLTNDVVDSLGPYALMKPNLKSQKDVDFLWSHIQDIDVVESDHAPHTKQEKDSENPPFGVPGLETTLPLLVTAVHENKIEREDITRLLYDNPRRILHLPEQQNTWVEIDENERYTLSNDALKTKCGWTPFAGWNVFGKIHSVNMRGKKIYDGEAVLTKPGSGKVIDAL
ncbi:amidohydrolase family protein [Candidatus Woesebacteria bacterium]|nr:amidohydrolase family protein [Candidatus Woesebacteria bacterium]